MSKIIAVTKPETVEGLKQAATGDKAKVRRIYDDYKSAKKAFDAAAELAKANNLPSHAVDKSAYVAGMSACVALLGTREDVDGEKKQGIKAVLMFPIPGLEALLGVELPEEIDEETGKSLGKSEAIRWIEKIAIKEASHVAFREIRNIDTTEEFEQVAAKLPATIQDFVEARSRGEGVDLDAFKLAWPYLKAMLKKHMPNLLEVFPRQQADLVKCFRSKSFAMRECPDLESRNIFASFLPKLVEICDKWTDDEGNPEPLDSDEIASWIETRDTREIGKAVDINSLDFAKVNSLLGDL